MSLIRRLNFNFNLTMARSLSHHHSHNHNHVTHPHKSEKIDGASLIARSLKEQGIEYVFGVAGIPIIKVAEKIQEYGIKYIGMRTEQSASYAASAIGYLTRKPAVCLTVSGPGFVNSLAGMANAIENAWPLVVISGSSETLQDSTGSFQEFRQVESAKHFSKYAARPPSLNQLPLFIEKAIRTSTYGRPGASYVDIPAEMISAHTSMYAVETTKVCIDPPRPFTSKDNLLKILESIKHHTNPLIIVGKEAAYSQAEKKARILIDRLGIPFLATPMGKGVIDDSHRLCVNAARSTALKHADLIILLGTKLNWMLHFGKAPRFYENVKIIQINNYAEELGLNTNNCILVHADVKSFCEQMNEYLDEHKNFDLYLNFKQNWFDTLRIKSEKNKHIIQQSVDDLTVPLNYYAAYGQIKKVIPEDAIIVAEGANTMDTSRAILDHKFPRHRLDAGSFGTMGVGTGFAIAAALYCRDYHPKKRVICIQGDSAFGFSGMEIEVAHRYNLPIVFIIFNNNGIYGGMDDHSYNRLKNNGDPALNLPPLALSPNVRYEKHADALPGCAGYYAQTPEEIRNAVKSALEQTEQPSVINIAIHPSANRKQQEYPWLTQTQSSH